MNLRKLLTYVLIPAFAVLLLAFTLLIAFGNAEDSSVLYTVGVLLLSIGIAIKIVRRKQPPHSR